ncbi:MAG: hypothetical protein LDL33_15485 [Desulfomonile sp.]|nr:hypothetical protein [Desulfomonile sp.]
MKVAVIVLLSLAFGVGAFAAGPASDPPKSQPTFGQPGGSAPAPPAARPPAGAQPARFYGYVPPPPILHVWPGGYRVIRQDLSNTLADHIGGHY